MAVRAAMLQCYMAEQAAEQDAAGLYGCACCDAAVLANLLTRQLKVKQGWTALSCCTFYQFGERNDI